MDKGVNWLHIFGKMGKHSQGTAVHNDADDDGDNADDDDNDYDDDGDDDAEHRNGKSWRR